MESASSCPSWKEAMEKVFERMDAEVVAGPGGSEENPNCRCELQTPKCDHVGSTAVVAVVSSDCVVVANCGDSRAVLSRKGAVVPLSVDHKVIRKHIFTFVHSSEPMSDNSVEFCLLMNLGS